MQSEKHSQQLKGNILSFVPVQMLEQTVFLNTGMLFVEKNKAMKSVIGWQYETKSMRNIELDVKDGLLNLSDVSFW